MKHTMLMHRKPNGTIEYERERWYEWLMVRVSGSLIKMQEPGATIPRWYLPVLYDFRSNSYQCWVFPLAPFALAFLIITRMLKGMWVDLLDFSKMLRLKYERHDDR